MTDSCYGCFMSHQSILISFGDENDKKTLTKRSYIEKKSKRLLVKDSGPFVLCGNFQLTVVVKMLSW